MAKKTWAEKMMTPEFPVVKELDKAFRGFDVGDKMLIPTPRLIDDYIKGLKSGQCVGVPILRESLAAQYKAQFTCPLTTGIFLRIVCEAAYDELDQRQKALKDITPFWRVVDPSIPLAKKLACGMDWLAVLRDREVRAN